MCYLSLTGRYVAPEVFKNEEYDTKVDVFSYALILQEVKFYNQWAVYLNYANNVDYFLLNRLSLHVKLCLVLNLPLTVQNEIKFL